MTTTPTRKQIIQLSNEAAEAGDQLQVEICNAALDGDDAAITECGRVIDEARAMGHTDAGSEYAAS